MFRTFQVFCCLLFLTCALPWAHAEASPPNEDRLLNYEELKLKEISVYAPKPILDSPSSTASRLGISVRETPASVYITRNATMLKRGYLSAAEAIEKMPGVLWGNHPAEPFNFSTRGFSGNQIHILRDGIWLGPSNMVGRPSNTFNLDRVELLKGPASVLHGQGVIGGAVNMITKSPIENNEYNGEALISYGRFDSYQTAAGLGGPISKKLWFRIDASEYGSEGYVDNADQSSLNVTSSLLWKPNERFKAKLQLDFLADELQNYWGTPLVSQSFAGSNAYDGVVTTTDGRTLDRRTRFVNYNVDNRVAESDQFFTRLDLSYKVSNNVNLRNTSYYFNADRKWLNAETYTFASSTGLIGRDRFFVEHDQDTVGNRFDVTVDSVLGSLKNRTVAGVDYRYFDFVRDSRFLSSVDSVSPFSPTSGTFIQPLRAFNNPTTIETVAVFFEDVLAITDQLKFVTGLRYDHIDLDRDSFNLNGTVNAGNAFERTFEPFSWRAGMVYEVAPNWSAYGQYSTGADPVGSNLFLVNGNQNFDLTEARQWEIGLKASFLEGRGQFTAAYFDIGRDNILVPAGSGGVVQNIGDQTSNGIEFEGAYQLTPHWNVVANAAFTDAEFGTFGANSGNTPPNVADWTVNAWTNYTNVAGTPLDVGAGVRYVDDRFGDNANIITLQDYTLTEIYGSYTWGPTTFTAKITNLFDVVYSHWLDTFYPAQPLLGSPRAFQLSAHFQF